MNEHLLSVQDLRVEYLNVHGAIRAVDGVSFDIGPGEVFGLAGESGSGKSTVAKAILRILGPPAVITRGAVRFRGDDLLEFDEQALMRFRWRSASLVFQSAMNVLNPVMTVGEQLTDVMFAHGLIKNRSALDRAAELFELVGLDRDRLR